MTWQIDEQGNIFHDGRLIGSIEAKAPWAGADVSNEFVVHGAAVSNPDGSYYDVEYRSIAAGGAVRRPDAAELEAALHAHDTRVDDACPVMTASCTCGWKATSLYTGKPTGADATRAYKRALEAIAAHRSTGSDTEHKATVAL